MEFKNVDMSDVEVTLSRVSRLLQLVGWHIEDAPIDATGKNAGEAAKFLTYLPYYESVLDCAVHEVRDLLIGVTRLLEEEATPCNK